MPYTSGIPKCMVEVEGRPLIQYQIDVLRKSNINDIIIVKGYQANKIEINGTKTFINNKYYETNMVYSLFCAESEFSGDVIVSYGDIAYSNSILKKLMISKHDISVVVDLDWKKYWMKRFDNPLDDAETLKYDDSGRIIEIGKTPKDYSDIMGQYIGLIKFTHNGLKQMNEVYKKVKKENNIQGKSVKGAYMTDFIQSIIDNDINVWPITIKNQWIEIDNVKDINLEITKNRLKSINSL